MLDTQCFLSQSEYEYVTNPAVSAHPDSADQVQARSGWTSFFTASTRPDEAPGAITTVPGASASALPVWMSMTPLIYRKYTVILAEGGNTSFIQPRKMMLHKLECHACPEIEVQTGKKQKSMVEN